MIKQAITPDLYKTVIERCQRQFFTDVFFCDEINDRGTEKMFCNPSPHLRRSLCQKTSVFDMPIVNTGTDDDLYTG